MTTGVNIQEIENANRRAQQLNSERQKLIGMKESATDAYNRAVTAYYQKYGVQLTEANLQAEYDKVAKKTAEDYQNLQQMIQSIESGEYKQQYVKQDSTVNQTQHVQETQSFTSQTVQYQPVQPVVNQEAVPKQAPQQPQQFGLSPNIAAQMNMFAQNQTPPQPANYPIQEPDEDVSEQPFTPEGWGSPDINKNFNNILNGGGGIKFGESN